MWTGATVSSLWRAKSDIIILKGCDCKDRARINNGESKLLKTDISIDGRVYSVDVIRRVTNAVDAPRLVVVSHLVNQTTRRLLDVCLRAVKQFTPEPYELWVVDNNSPEEHLEWLIQQTDVNLALSRIEPLPPEARTSRSIEAHPPSQQEWGSYANAVALQIAIGLIDPESQYLMPLHMDALPCRSGWLSFLQGKVSGKTAAAGVRMDRTRTPEGVLHVLGYLVDFTIFQALGLDFFPDLPALDVGDRVTVRLREAGYHVFACPNTVWEPQLAERIPRSSPLRDLHVDRSFDDDGNVIFLHLGRGTRRSTGEHNRGTSVQEWLDVMDLQILA